MADIFRQIARVTSNYKSDKLSDMDKHTDNSKRMATILIYGRVPLIFGGLICALGVMWTKDPIIYTVGVSLLFISMAFDVSGVWIASRFEQVPALTQLADRVMDKLVYSIIFPLVAVGEMWRLQQFMVVTQGERLHAIFVLILCITVLIRDNFAHFMRNFSIKKGEQPEPNELSRLRILVAAPIAAILYAHAFYIPGFSHLPVLGWFSWFGNLSLRLLFFIEIIFLVINFGSIARYCKKYGSSVLDELCFENDLLRRRILSFFPNTLTVMNAIMGLLSVFFAYQGRIQEAYLILMGAAFFDKLDGALARKLGLTQSKNAFGNHGKITTGAILDDISDAISFCICPGWIFYIVFSEHLNGMVFFLPIVAIAVFYAIMGIIRLIYFTLDKNPIPGFFKGLPTPAAALLVTAPIMIFNHNLAAQSNMVQFWGKFCSFWMIFIAAMMNFYPIRYLHVGRFMDQHPWFTWASTFFLFIFIFTPFFGHAAFIFMLSYLLSPFFTHKTQINTTTSR
jgi:CDP-diacylglycerol---serine O-phosphatidyltransferase